MVVPLPDGFEFLDKLVVTADGLGCEPMNELVNSRISRSQRDGPEACAPAFRDTHDMNLHTSVAAARTGQNIGPSGARSVEVKADGWIFHRMHEHLDCRTGIVEKCQSQPVGVCYHNIGLLSVYGVGFFFVVLLHQLVEKLSFAEVQPTCVGFRYPVGPQWGRMGQ
ncbi:hypothetical protein K438DRAFT_1986845 [Mycena galopus ATCC 62051]|nr:hypothetical protein K438DRAFT_1986845 [Mycena galopus ATCC 62051]